ncbi:MAG: SLC13 family permease, partial [Planctomycetota bacterium]
ARAALELTRAETVYNASLTAGSRIFELSFPGAPSVGFGQWLLIGLPISLVGLVTAYLVLSKVIFRRRHDLHLDREVIRAEKRELGAMRFEERVVLAIFALTASLWIFRKDLELGGVVIQGWADLLPYSALVDDGTVAIFMALFLFLIPARSRPGGGPAQRDKDNDKDEARAVRLLDVSVFARIPWHIILLFGGGFALASGFRTSGLSDFIGGRFSALQGAPTILFVGVISGGMTFLTELTSNTATTELILPILASIATELKVDPRLFMVPATISASFAFMLPAATPPNAIVFASERLRVADMVRAGILLNLLGILLITLMLLLLLPIAFGVSLQEAPPWIEG